MAQSQSARLCAQRAAGANPAQQRARVGYLRQQLVAQVVHAHDRRACGHPAAVGEGNMDALIGQRRGHGRYVVGGHAQDHPDLGLIGLHPRERVHVQDLARQGRHLVGGHHPRADDKQQRELSRQRSRAKSPARNRAHAAWWVEDHIRGIRIAHPPRPIQGLRLGLPVLGEARPYVLTQLGCVVGET
jgi:hypothetical protein